MVTLQSIPVSNQYRGTDYLLPGQALAGHQGGRLHGTSATTAADFGERTSPKLDGPCDTNVVYGQSATLEFCIANVHLGLDATGPCDVTIGYALWLECDRGAI
jgi:hypothetical protein